LQESDHPQSLLQDYSKKKKKKKNLLIIVET
jgi:hypothetical protein